MKQFMRNFRFSLKDGTAIEVKIRSPVPNVMNDTEENGLSVVSITQ